MDKPLVSVVVPAYNAEKYLDETIKSVVAQAYSNWELIIVDDGSTDGSAAIAKAWAEKDKRIIYVYQTNQKMATARNTGIARAKGKYIAFLDADNLFLPKKLEMQVAHLEAHPEVGVSCAHILHFYEHEPQVLYENKNEVSLAEDQFSDFLHRNSVNVLAVLVHKECFDKYGAFQEGWKACDEQYVWINLAAHSVPFAYIPDTVGLLRLHDREYSVRREFIFETATYSLKMLDIVEAALTPERQAKYKEDFAALRKEWNRKLFIGKLLQNPLFSWFMMPLFLLHRGKNFTKATKKQ